MKTALGEDLRERYVDLEAGRASLDHALGELAAWREEWERTEDPVAHSNVGRWLQRSSEYARLLGELEHAVALKDEALDIWASLDKPRASFLVRLQRALVLAELGEPEAASEMSALAAQMDGDESLEPFYLGFWLDYDARRRFWLGDHAGAEAALERALDFRRANRAARIVERTEQMLASVRTASRRV